MYRTAALASCLILVGASTQTPSDSPSETTESRPPRGATSQARPCPSLRTKSEVREEIVSRREAVQRAKRETRKFRLRLTSVEARLSYWDEWTILIAAAGDQVCDAIPAWKINMRGAFRNHGYCWKSWRIVIHARSGRLYESSSAPGLLTKGCFHAT